MHKAALAGLFGIVALLVFFELTENPPLWYDEGIYSQVSQNIALYGKDALQVAPGEFVSAWSVNGGLPFLAPVAASYALFDVGVLQSRLVMALFIFSLCAAAYVLLRKLTDKTTALLALLLLATFPSLYGNGKTMLGEVPGLLYLCLFLFTLNHIDKQSFRSHPATFFAAGLLLGLCITTKPLFLPLLGAIALMALVRFRSINWSWRWIAAGTGGLALPVAAHLGLHFSGIDTLSSLSSYYSNPYAIDLLATIAQNTARFFTELSPLYCAALMGIWGLSLAVRWWRGHAIPLAEGVAFSFAFLLLLFYLRTAGWYRYFFVTNVLALLFLPSSLKHIAQALPASVAGTYGTRIAGVIVALCVALQGYQLLFSSWIAEQRGSTTTAELVARFAQIPSHASIFFDDVPELVVFTEGRPYYQYLAPAPGFSFGTSTQDVDITIQRGGDTAGYTFTQHD